ncbi:MAG: hypothetical protein Q7W45_05220 [Bacteroidota bacterium]|nr:hypothetical protein [Bacteroidota bacterium]MDP3144848.1 hypothetical protein [Bacteroidota bacterium]MDP3555772.1 hypothetical protein [Bacteroidota bacterium]
MKQVLAIVCLLFVLSCKKKNVDGVVLITVTNDGKVVSNPVFYMKKGVTKNPNIPLSSYDLSVTGNSFGQVSFENLASDNYFFYVTAKIDTLLISGEVTTLVSPKKAPNRYELKIYAE